MKAGAAAVAKGTRRPARAKGFTLVEVLVSLGIFALAAVVLGSAYVNVLFNYHTMRAHSNEKNDIAFVRAAILRQAQRDVAEKGGQMRTTDDRNLQWTVKIDETERADLFQVTVEYEITPVGAEPRRRKTETFLLLRPTWSDPAEREKLRAEFREQLEKERRT